VVRYSYSLNSNGGTYEQDAAVQAPSYTNAPLPRQTHRRALRTWGLFNGKIGSVKKTLRGHPVICEDEQQLTTANVFVPNPYQ
jgi:hypothetical protein